MNGQDLLSNLITKYANELDINSLPAPDKEVQHRPTSERQKHLM